MKKIIFLFALSASVASFAKGNNSVEKSFSDKDLPAVERIKQSTLVIILLEENEDYLAKLSKKGENDIAATYSKSIKTYNDNIQAMAPQYLKISRDVVFKTPSEIVAMSTEERRSYSYLLYDKSMSIGPRGFVVFTCNFYSDNPKDVQKNMDDYENSIQFECLSEKDGPGEYRKLDIYAPNTKKNLPRADLEQNLIEIVPTQADVKICLQQLQQKFDFMVKNENTSGSDERKAMKAETDKNMASYYDTIKHKTLLICKQDIDKSFSVALIKKYYPYNYKVVSKEEFDKAILANDAQYCALVVSPLIKVPGIYGPVTATSVKYVHIIIDLGTGNTLYTGVSGHVMIGTSGMGGYQTITEKNLTQLTQELQNPGK